MMWKGLVLRCKNYNTKKERKVNGSREGINKCREEDYLVVTNNLQAKNSVSYSTGTGLHNIRLRYQLIFNKEIVIEKTSTHFIVKLPLVA